MTTPTRPATKGPGLFSGMFSSGGFQAGQGPQLTDVASGVKGVPGQTALTVAGQGPIMMNAKAKQRYISDPRFAETVHRGAGGEAGVRAGQGGNIFRVF